MYGGNRRLADPHRLKLWTKRCRPYDLLELGMGFEVVAAGSSIHEALARANAQMHLSCSSHARSCGELQPPRDRFRTIGPDASHFGIIDGARYLCCNSIAGPLQGLLADKSLESGFRSMYCRFHAPIFEALSLLVKVVPSVRPGTLRESEGPCVEAGLH